VSLVFNNNWNFFAKNFGDFFPAKNGSFVGFSWLRTYRFQYFPAVPGPFRGAPFFSEGTAMLPAVPPFPETARPTPETDWTFPERKFKMMSEFGEREIAASVGGAARFRREPFR
jgi:hypothetical protein